LQELSSEEVNEYQQYVDSNIAKKNAFLESIGLGPRPEVTE